MGRTLPTQIQMLRNEEVAWKSFRRALRKEDQSAFDDIWAYARRHSTAASMASRPLPYEAYFLSMIVGLKREIESLRDHYEMLQRDAAFKKTPDAALPCRGTLAPPDGEIV